MAPVLDVAGLTTVFRTRTGLVRAVQDVSFSVGAGETLAIVGESGCGKTMTALSLMRLIPPPGDIIAGSVKVDGIDLLTLNMGDLRRMRGSRIAMIFQEPMTALNPLLTVGRQIAEMVSLHEGLPRRAAPPGRGRWTCCIRSAFRRRNGGPASTRTRCPAGCGSAR
jgi:peptide/nickel transport system ATP-binding protein